MKCRDLYDPKISKSLKKFYTIVSCLNKNFFIKQQADIILHIHYFNYKKTVLF